MVVGWLSGSACATAQDLRIEHVTIISPELSQPLRNADVTVRDGRIVSVTVSTVRESNVRTLDGRGLYLIPGLIDSHVHLGTIPGMTEAQEHSHPDIARIARQQIPRSYLYSGFTTLVDLDSNPEAMARWKSRSPVPDTHFCGGAAVMDGYPMNWLPRPQRYQAYPYMIVQRGDEAAAPAGIDVASHTPAAVVARMKADGAMCVKTFFHRFEGQNLPEPRLDTLQELVRAAHSAGMPVLLHAIGPEGQRLGVDAGVDIIAHGLWEWTGDPHAPDQLTPEIKKVLDRVLETHTGLQPTMQVSYGFRDLFDPAYLSDPKLKRFVPPALMAWYGSAEGQWFRDSMAQSGDAAAKWRSVQATYAPTIARNNHATRYFTEHNGRLLFGTDTPAVPTYANPPGLNGWLEMKRLVKAGVTPAQIFRAATLANAEALGLSREIGTVEVGKRANLLLVRADPRKTIQAYAEIDKVILGGRVLDPHDLEADHGVP